MNRRNTTPGNDVTFTDSHNDSNKRALFATVMNADAAIASCHGDNLTFDTIRATRLRTTFNYVVRRRSGKKPSLIQENRPRARSPATALRENELLRQPHTNARKSCSRKGPVTRPADRRRPDLCRIPAARPATCDGTLGLQSARSVNQVMRRADAPARRHDRANSSTRSRAPATAARRHRHFPGQCRDCAMSRQWKRTSYIRQFAAQRQRSATVTARTETHNPAVGNFLCMAIARDPVPGRVDLCRLEEPDLGLRKRLRDCRKSGF